MTRLLVWWSTRLLVWWFLVIPAASFQPSPSLRGNEIAFRQHFSRSDGTHALHASAADTAAVLLPLAAFSGTHVGLSNVREGIIQFLGDAAETAGLVGTGARLPAIFSSGYADDGPIFPDSGVAGRQLFRLLYSAIAFATLGATGQSYAAVEGIGGGGTFQSQLLQDDPALAVAAFTLAALAQSVSISSLANPSPLSLVPAWVPSEDNAGGLKRDDSVKLRAYGLTRITRHPLILPVLPWGIGNAVLAGGDSLDWILFGGLGIYAVVGCWAQDQRAKENAAVGTVFAAGDLTSFYTSTSFAPFSAMIDGRQDPRIAASEVLATWPVLVLSAVLGAWAEWAVASQF